MFCLTDPLLRYVLGQVEKSPQATFTEAELRRVSSDEFEALVKAKLLKYKKSDPDQETFPCPTPCDKGCDMVIGKVREGYEAICQGHSDVKPIPLAEGDLKRYAFDIDSFLAKVKKKNQLVGMTHAINDRVFFVGERTIAEKRIGVFLAFLRNKREADSALLGLSNQIRTYQRTLVLLPLFDRSSQSVLKKLESQDIVVTRFEEAFPKSDLAIDFARLERRRPKVGVEYPPMTPEQQRDRDVHGYKCEDRLYLTGIEPKKRSNLVLVNGKEIRVPDSEMLLLLHLVRELKKGKGGWVTTDELYKQEITEEDTPHGLIGRLRAKLRPGLQSVNPEDFIENKNGSYRISIHPDFAIVEKKDWLVKKYNVLKGSIKKEREKRKLQEQRRQEAEARRARSKQN